MSLSVPGEVGAWGLLAPAKPDQFTGDARAAWELQYPAAMATYYRMLADAFGVSGLRGLLERKCGCGGFESSVGGSGIGECVGHCRVVLGGETGRNARALRGAVGGCESPEGACEEEGSGLGGGAQRAESVVGNVCDVQMPGLGHAEAGSRDQPGGQASVRGEEADARVFGGKLGAEQVVDGAGCLDGERVVADKPLGKHYRRNRQKKFNKQAAWRERSARDSGVDCSSGVSVGSVHTVDTRTGVEIEAAQTLAARRVAENLLAVKKAEADRLLVEHRIRALQDKSRTKAVEKLAATRMEERINKSKKNSEEAFKQCEASLKSLGSTGSAGEFALKQQIKDARDNEAILKYIQEQNKIYARNATPEVLNAVSRVKAPVIQEEYDAFGDCPSDYDEDEAEAYNNDRNRRNDEMAQRLQGLDEAPLW